MDRLVFYLFLIFKLAIELSVFSIIPITIIIIINKFLNKKIPVKFQYILYIFIFIRLVFPVMPKSSLSLFNNVKGVSVLNHKDVIVDMIRSKDEFTSYDSSLNYYKQIDGSFKNTKYISFFDGIKKFDFYTRYWFLLWCAGVGSLAIYNMLSYTKFHNKIKYGEKVKEKKALDSIIECSKVLKIKSNFKLLELTFINSPAVFGIKKPVILIPKGLLTKIKEEDLKNILLHELYHYKRRDIFIIYLCKFICILYWFNPLVWYAAHKLKKALELSCDERVLSYMNEEERISYGYTIINLVSHSKSNYKACASLNMVENKKDIGKRLRFIRDFKDKGLCTTIVSLVLVILTGVTMLTECDGRVSAAVDKEVVSNHVVDKQGRIRKIDDLNMPFKSDNKVLGKWVVVDFVTNTEDFNPDKRIYKGDLCLKQLEFIQNGTTCIIYKEGKAVTIYEKWTKDFVLDFINGIASKYYIKNIEGSEYIFFQWKNGDYAFRNRVPCYYVLKKVK